MTEEGADRMFFSTIQMHSMRVLGTDGEAGYADSFVFSRGTWQCRYVVVRLDESLGGGEAILPAGMLSGSAEGGVLRLGVDIRLLAENPGFELSSPIARGREKDIHRYYGWPPYWAEDEENREPGFFIGQAMSGYEQHGEAMTEFCTTSEIIGYHVQGNDAELGEVRDMLIDGETRRLEFIVVEVSPEMPTKVVDIARVERVDWIDRHIYADISRAEAVGGPDHSPGEAVDPQFQKHLEALHYW